MRIEQFYSKSYHSLESELIEYCTGNKGRVKQLIFANAYSVALGENDNEFDFILNRSLVLPDGFSIIAAARLLNITIKDKISGPDFILDFLKICSKKKLRCFFLGGDSEEDAKLLISTITEKYPDLEITGFYSPPFGIWTSDENDKIIQKINNSRTDVLWVGLGTPKQDKWIFHNRNRLNVKMAAGVGAAFNFVTGKVKRAPKIIQECGFEWLFRLLSEPRRLWRRYLIGNGFFCMKIIKSYFRIN